MGTRRDHEIDRLFEEAERRQSCLVAGDRNLREALERRVGRGVERVESRLFARTNYWNGLSKIDRERHVIRGLAVLHPDWVFCHASAALMHGLPVSLRKLRQACLMRPGTHSKACAARKRQSKKPRTIVVISGVKCTSLEDTVVDCLLDFGFREGLAIADAALARLDNDGEQLERLLRKRGHHRPGLRRALETIRWADARSESGGESIARAIMIEHGFVLPELQVVIGNPTRTGESWRCDYYWLLADGTRVAGELDGLEKYTNEKMTKGRSALQVLSDERIRESQLTLAVDRVLRFTWADVRDEQRLVAKLEQFGIPRVNNASRAIPHPHLRARNVPST